MIEHFKAWLLRTWLLTRDCTEDGAQLVVLCRADSGAVDRWNATSATHAGHDAADPVGVSCNTVHRRFLDHALGRRLAKTRASDHDGPYSILVT